MTQLSFSLRIVSNRLLLLLAIVYPQLLGCRKQMDKNAEDYVSDVSALDDSSFSSVDERVTNAEGDSSDNGDTSSNCTMTPNHGATPKANSSNVDVSVTPISSQQGTRLSMSQPAISSIGKGKPRGVPILQTLEENEALKVENFNLKHKLVYAQYREDELTVQLSREVQDVMQEFFALQMGKRDMDEKLEQFDELKKQADEADAARETAERAAERAKHRLQSVEEMRVKEGEQLKLRIAELEAQLEAERSAKTSGRRTSPDDSVFSIEPEYPPEAEREINSLKDKKWELQQENGDLLNRIDDMNAEMEALKERLQEALEKQSDAGSKTFTMNNTSAQYQIRIDALESALSAQNTQYKDVIAHYLNRMNALEKALEKWQGTCDDSMMILDQFNFKEPADRNKMGAMVELLMKKLSSERQNNRRLREQCRQIGGGPADDESMMSTQSTQRASPARIASAAAASNDVDGLQNTTLDYEAILRGEGTANNLSQMMANFRALGVNVDESIRDIPGAVEGSPIKAELSTFSQPAGIRVEYAVGGDGPQDSLLNNSASAQQPLLNRSLVEMEDLHQSFRAAGSEMRVTQKNLLAVRQLMTAMFDRLKGSAALFEDVVEFLSDGSPESKEMADRIREMQLVWSNSVRDGGDLSIAIEAAERSMVEMQGQICHLEASLNVSAATSFLLNVTRMTMGGCASDRLSAANMSQLLGQLNNSMRQQQSSTGTPPSLSRSRGGARGEEHQQQSPSIHQTHSESSTAKYVGDHSNTVGGVSSSEATSAVAELERQVDNLKHDLTVKQEEVNVLTQRVTEFTIRCDEAAAARDSAMQTAEVLRRQLSEERIAASQRQMEREELMSQIEDEKAIAVHERSLNDVVRAELDKVRHELEEKTEEWQSEQRRLETEVTQLTSTRDELADRVLRSDSAVRDAADDLEEMKHSLDQCGQELAQKKSELQQLAQQLRDAQGISDGLSSDLSRIQSLMQEQDKQHQRAMTQIHQLTVDRDTAQQNRDDAIARMLELEAQLEGRPSMSNRPSLDNPIELSMVTRSMNKVSRDAQTDITKDSMQKLLEDAQKATSLSRALTNLQFSFVRLSAAVTLFVNEEPISENKIQEAVSASVTDAVEVDMLRQSAEKLVENIRDTYDERVVVVKKLKEYTDKLERIDRNVVVNAKSEPSRFQKAEAPEYIRTAPENRYQYSLRQNLYQMTVKAMDVVENIKVAEKNLERGYVYSLAVILDEARALRGDLHDCLQDLSLNKENEMPDSVDVLKSQLDLASVQNKSILAALHKYTFKYEELRKHVPVKNTDLLVRIGSEMKKIHGVLENATQVAGKFDGSQPQQRGRQNN